MTVSDPEKPRIVLGRISVWSELLRSSARREDGRLVDTPRRALVFYIEKGKVKLTVLSTRARQSSECLVGLWGKPLIRTHASPFPESFQI
jgi:hypothetical protein